MRDCSLLYKHIQVGLLNVLLRWLRQWTFRNLLAFYDDVFSWIPKAYRPSVVNILDCSQHTRGYHQSLETLSYMTLIYVVATRHRGPIARVRNVRVNIYIYTGCPRRNVSNFGRVFLRLKYTDITQNTYIQSWTVTEIMAREKCGLLAVPHTVPAQLMQSAGHVQYAFSQRPAILIQLCSRLIPKCAVSKR